MDRIDNSEAWRQIPPEEKFALMSRAHASGMLACTISLILGCTLAVGLHMQWLIWAPIVATPLIFQFAAGKAWRDLRPKIMLEYLAARSAARRYAYTADSKDLGVRLILRGHAEELFDQDHIQDAMEAIIADNKHASVWLALFNDALVIMAEKQGGAQCVSAQIISERIHLESKSLDDDGEYSKNKELYLTMAPERTKPAKRFKITSDFPAALVVFEKKLQQAIAEAAGDSKRTSSASAVDLDAELLGIDQ